MYTTTPATTTTTHHSKRHPTSSNVIQSVISVIQTVIQRNPKRYPSPKTSSKVLQTVIQRHPKRHPTSFKTSSVIQNVIRHQYNSRLILNSFAIQRYRIKYIHSQMTIQLPTYVVLKRSSNDHQNVLK